MPDKKTLDVHYDGDLDDELDRRIIASMKSIGYQIYYSKYHYEKKTRHMAFEEME